MGDEAFRESGTVKNRVTVSTQVITDEPTSFLFVNETPDAPTYKQGNRHDVRSHVRKKAATEFWTKHKNAKQRAANQPKYVPLASQGVKAASLKQVGVGPECLSCAASRKSKKPSNADFGTAKLVEIIDPFSKAVAQSKTVEIERSIELQDGLASSCKACGQPIGRSTRQNRRSLQENRTFPTWYKERTIVKLNIVGALGAGRVDPFSILPMAEPDQYSKELMDHGT